MSGWFFQGLRNGIRTTAYPRHLEAADGTRETSPIDTEFSSSEEAAAVAARCPTGALRVDGSRIQVDRRFCIHCFRCARGAAPAMQWGAGPMPHLEVSESDGADEPRRSPGGPVAPPFRRSLHILVVDAGDCGACLNEVRQLNAPQYNMHRLGFFITPTPRDADALLVVGQVTDAMQEPLLAAYRAMAQPKWVVAVGSCALSGAPIGASFAAGAGVREVLPVDVEVPGSPPAPLAVLDALLLLSGRDLPRREERA